MAFQSLREIGAMRERLAILQRTETTDTHGGRSVTWSTLDTVWAELMPPERASEGLGAQAIQAVIDYRFRVRARADVTSDMRVQWRPSWRNAMTPKTLEIHGVVPDKDGRTYAFLKCGEVAA